MKTSNYKIYIFTIYGLFFASTVIGSDFLEEGLGDKTVLFDSVYPTGQLDFSSSVGIEENEKSDGEKTTLLRNDEELYVKTIFVTGNKITKDKVILRQLEFKSGDTITNKKLKNSQFNLEFLDFFKRKNSVVLKVHRLEDNFAEVEVVVKEKKPVQIQFGVGYSRTPYHPIPAVVSTITVKNENLFGRRLHVGAMLQLYRYELEQYGLHFSSHDFFGLGIFGETGLYHTTFGYPYWFDAKLNPTETHDGAWIKFGYPLTAIGRGLYFYTMFGFEKIKNNDPSSDFPDLNKLMEQRFRLGNLKWLGFELEKDRRNHPLEPTGGYKLSTVVKTALPAMNKNFSFLKTELKGDWYYSLIGKDKLVFSLHGFAGSVHLVDSNKIIPYSELFHVGGPFSVRGFSWGQIDPSWDGENPLGGRYALQTSAELIFPIIDEPNLALFRHCRMKGHLFYDSGACWNTPKHEDDSNNELIIDKFKLRHSIGCGLSFLKPINLKFDIGYKLDRKIDESPYEINLSMNFTW